MARLAFREQVLRVREDAIISSVNRLLADKGFDLMTVDEVAADVGIAKASLVQALSFQGSPGRCGHGAPAADGHWRWWNSRRRAPT
jgi:hypothetical protein